MSHWLRASSTRIDTLQGFERVEWSDESQVLAYCYGLNRKVPFKNTLR